MSGIGRAPCAAVRRQSICAGARVCAIASEARSAIASGHQQRDVDVIQDVLPGEPRSRRPDRRWPRPCPRCVAGADRPGHGGVTAKERLHRRGEPERRGLADPLALAAEWLLEVAAWLEPDANSRRNQLHRFDGAPFRYRQEMLAHSAAAQQQLAPVERFQRLRDTFGGCGCCSIDAAIGVDRCPDGRRAQT